MRAWIVGTVLIAGIAAARAEPLPNVPRGAAYPAAREALIRSGWAPVGDPSDPASCAGEDDRCRWPETEGCSGTGQGFCTYAWKKNSARIIVTTRGDDHPVVARVDRDRH